MAASWCGSSEQVLQRPVSGRDGHEIGAELATGHAARIGDALGAVEMPGLVMELDERTAAACGIGLAASQRARDVAVVGNARIDAHAGNEALRLEAPAGNRDAHLLHGHAGHALRLPDSRANGQLRGVGIDDHAGLHAAAALVADAEKARAPALLTGGDQAHDLARADVERGDDRRPAREWRGPAAAAIHVVHVYAPLQCRSRFARRYDCWPRRRRR